MWSLPTSAPAMAAPPTSPISQLAALTCCKCGDVLIICWWRIDNCNNTTQWSSLGGIIRKVSSSGGGATLTCKTCYCIEGKYCGCKWGFSYWQLFTGCSSWILNNNITGLSIYPLFHCHSPSHIPPPLQMLRRSQVSDDTISTSKKRWWFGS